MKRVFLDSSHWTYSRRNTDWKLKQKMADILGAYGVQIPHGLLWNVVCFIFPMVIRCMPSAIKNRVQNLYSAIRARLIERMHPDLFVTQGPNPPLPKNCKVLWELYFLYDESDVRQVMVNRRGGTSFWVKQIERYASNVDFLAVRGQLSVRQLKDTYPEYSSKVLNLGFVKEEYDIMSPADVATKQIAANSVIEILFVGREARRKGLDLVLKTCLNVRAMGLVNFRLTIVSDLRDGNIEIPKCNWIVHYDELSHDQVLRLMKLAHIFIMPSRQESYGLVYHEAMASGCVVFVRNGEPQLEFIEYGKAGCVADWENMAKLQEDLITVVQNPELRKQLALNGLARYVERYSQHIVRNAWIKVIGS